MNIFFKFKKSLWGKKNLSKFDKLKPLKNYARNKIITENEIRALLKRSLILGISNIIRMPIKNLKIL